MMERKIKSTVKYPTSLIVNGAGSLGVELADSLLEQGGYVIIVDTKGEEQLSQLERIADSQLLSFVDHSALAGLSENLRRLDYIFYFAHDSIDLTREISTQQFLEHSNYLDGVLELSVKFGAKFLLSTSIKAHQLLVASKELDLNFGTSNKSKHVVYSEMEIQRYAESLVLEYINKVDLDGRILRLGEIIGEGMDFVSDTAFTKMIMAAVSGNRVPVYKDGLSAEWYVHLLDAVYGLIKAQFSRSTKGEFYTLAYEENFSDLSIAYKIHELEPEADEIEFIAEKNESTLPPLQLYKPARNLTHIGWKPKVDFDEAVKQSLYAAKLFLAENTAHKLITAAKPAANKPASKLKSFLTLARNVNDAQAATEAETTPINKLLAERKKAEKIRTLNISSASNKLKQKGNRSKGFWPSRVLWGGFLSLRRRFQVLGNMTPGQFGFWVIFIVFALFAYFYVVSPAVVLGRNYFIAAGAVDRSLRALGENRYQSLTSDLAIVNGALLESNKLLGRFSGIANTLGLAEQYQALADSLDAYQLYASGMLSISRSLDPLYQYLAVYENKVFYRPSSESYLATSESKDYQDFLRLLNSGSGLAHAGQEEVETALSKIGQVNVDALPTEIASRLKQVNLKLVDLRTVTGAVPLTDASPLFLGLDQVQTYLLLLQDNSRFTPSGGEVMGYLMISLDKGAVTEIKAQSIGSASLNLGEVDAIYRQMAQSLKPTGGEFTYNDLGYINNFNDYALANVAMWEKHLSRELSGVFTLNLTALQTLVAEATRLSNEPLIVENIEFNGVNLLTNLKNAQGTPESLSRRADLSTQILATVLTKLLARLGDNYMGYISTLSQLRSTKDLQFLILDQQLQRVLVSSTDQLKNADSYMRLSLGSDSRVLSPQKFPSVNLATRATFGGSVGIAFTAKIKFPSLQTIDNLSVCFPTKVTNITVSGVGAERVQVRQVDRERCAVIDILDESEVDISWESAIARSTNSQYNLVLGVYKQPGVTIVSDYELKFDSSLKVISTSPTINLDSNQKIFTETMLNDRNINILLTK